MRRFHYMQKQLSISAFFPCYNDGGTIASMVALADLTLKKLTDDYEILIIDDGSTDHSRAILRELEEKYLNLRVLLHKKNRGYGGALKTGFYSAKKDWIFYTDGDFQYDVSELSNLMEKLDSGIDVVNGYKISRSDPFYRKIIGQTYRLIMKLMFGFKIKDVDCDFRLIRRAILYKIRLEYDSGIICVEMVKKFQDAGFVFAEAPVHHYYRVYGKSQFFNVIRVFQVGRDILRLWWKLVIRKERTTR